MRSALIVLTVVALLVVGILAIQNMQSETVDGISQQDAIEKAEEAADAVERASERTEHAVKDVMRRMKAND